MIFDFCNNRVDNNVFIYMDENAVGEVEPPKNKTE